MANSHNLLIAAVGIGTAFVAYHLAGGHAGPGDPSGNRAGLSPRMVITKPGDLLAQLGKALGMRLDPTETSPIEDRRGETNGDLADQLGPPRGGRGQCVPPQDEGDGGDFRQAGGPSRGSTESRDPPEVDPSRAHGRRLGCWDREHHRPAPLSYCRRQYGGR